MSRPYATDSDPVQRLLAFAYLQAQQAGAVEDLRKDTKVLSAVLAAQGHIAASGMDLEQTLEYIAEGACRLTDAGGAAIALREDNKVVCRGRSGLLAPDLDAYLNPHSGVCGACLSSGEVQLCDDTEHDPRVDLWVCRNLGMRSILAVPLRRQQDVLGVLVVFSGWAGVFGERDVRSLRLLAGLVIEALWSEEIRSREMVAAEVMEAVDEPISAAVPLALELDEIPESKIPEDEIPEDGVPEGVVGLVPDQADLLPEALESPESVETPTLAETELPAPVFAMLEASGPRPMWRRLALVAAALVLMAAGTEAVLRHRAQVIELLHRLRPASRAALISGSAPAASPTPSPPGEPAASALALPLASAGPSQLLAIRSWSKPEETTIALFLQAPARWEAGMLADPSRIYFDLQNTQLAADLVGKSREGLAVQVEDGLVKRARVGQRDGSAVRVVIDLAASAQYSAVLSPSEPYRLMIVVRGTQAPSVTPARPEPGPQRQIASADTRPPTPRPVPARPKIVIDPGHGGTEDGAVGHGGLKEKDLTLEIAKRLGDLLASRLSAEVIYTRTSDLTVPLESRAEIANQAGADLFISIHANSSDDPNARGFETYYVAHSSSPLTVSLTGRDGEAKNALKPVSEDNKQGESRKLAGDVQQALHHAFGGERGVLNRGIKQAPFVVLLDADMPSILAEVAFVSSPADEQKLSTAEGQEAVADALYRGIAHYLFTARRGKVVASLSATTGQ